MKAIVAKTFKGVLTLDVVTGIQAGRRVYAGVLPMRVLRALFALDDAAIDPDQRAQRTPSPVRIAKLADIDWTRTALHWLHRATDGRRILKSSRNILLTANYLMIRLGLDLPAAARSAERALPTAGPSQPVASP